ncbi:MAG: glucose/mannose-6-phosphate isomerase [Thermoplasmata archaeon]|nr:glucose/mannose-6-phosphate isomerase [Thermoplasmata archaeon]
MLSAIPELRDPSGFLPSIQAKAKLVEDGFAAGKAGATAKLQPAGLLIAGMGFSGLGADVAMDACSRVMDVPVAIVKHYQVPRHARKGWHVLAVTYSGETEETLAVTKAAVARDLGVTAFTTGGAVAKLVPHVVPQPPGFQPRAAFAFTWFSLLGFLEGAGLLAEPVPVREAAAAVRAVDQACGPDVPEERNEARQLARKLLAPIPQIYASPALHGIGLHFRSMLNENAKKIADCDLLPECNHNDLTGWGGDLANRRHFAVLCLSHGAQNPQLQKRVDYMRQRYGEWGVPWLDRRAGPITDFKSHVVEQARLMQFLDYTSVYVAQLKGEDPAEIREIKALKAHLKA